MATFHIDFYSNALKRITPVTAVIPVEKPEIPGFPKPEPNKPFRTVYLLHGYSGCNVDWLYGSRISALSMLFNVAAVMPSCNNSFYLDDAIKNEYYEKYVCEELVDFTRKAFPLSHAREDTAVAGLSMGGYGALHSGLKHGDVFGSVFAFSSALITDEIAKLKEGEGNAVAPYSYYRHVFGDLSKLTGSDKDLKALAKKAAGNGWMPKIFMACGTEDFLLDRNRDLHRFFSENGIAHEYRESAGVHNWAFWDEYIEKAFEWLYGKPPAMPAGPPR
jgi:putative tributyrin esterase